MTAPERIWFAARPGDDLIMRAHAIPHEAAVEYVREDLHVAEVERLLEVAALWLDRIERDRGEPDKVLAQARSLRAALAIGAKDGGDDARA